MSERKEYTIGEICSRFSSGKSIKASQISAEGLYPVYGGNGLRGFTDTFNFDGECSIIGRQGAYCGNVRYFKGKAFMTEHAIVAVVNENHNNGYVSNLLSMMNLAQYQGQSAQPGLSVSTLSKITIKLPDLATQEQCFNVLNLIDQKIQINNQINQELEDMAKTLYDYWFVQFDFPDQNGKPYKSSGGKMIYNPELKREIPEGWGVEKISEFLVLNKDKYNKELNWQKIHYLETSNLIENKIEKLKKLDIKSDKIPSRAKEIVKDRDILYSLVRPNQMHFGFIRNPIQNLVASTGFVLLSCEDNPIYNIFFYLFMTLPNNVRRMIKLSESSTSSYPSIRPEDILNMEIVTPYDFSNYRSLVEYLDKIYYQIDVLYKQNEALIQLRDWLLPMLMNGQVKVER